MYIKLITILTVIYCTNSDKLKSYSHTKTGVKNSAKKVTISTTTTTQEPMLENLTTIPPIPLTVPPLTMDIKPKEDSMVMIPSFKLKQWAGEISEKLHFVEKKVVRREVLIKGFSEFKASNRDGNAIVDDMAEALEDLLNQRIEAAENIMRHAEELAESKTDPPSSYVFDRSLNINKLKKEAEPEDYEVPLNCSSLQRVSLRPMKHFDSEVGVSLDISSVQVSPDVFDCDKRVLPDIYWSEGLLQTFKKNFEQDAMIDFQYFCSAKGFLRHYPAAEWTSHFKLPLIEYDEEEGLPDPADVYDCRLRPWYVAAGGAPRDVLILFDASGSMKNSSNLFHAEQFTLALLTALTDDDQVNVLRFNVLVESPITCFNDKLVSANFVNSAAMMAVLRMYRVVNETWMADILRESVQILQREQRRSHRPPACQQAIVLLTDSIPLNYTDIVRQADPSGRIRVFVIWLHDTFGLRDNSLEFGRWLGCGNDGHLTELLDANDVTEQVMRILRVLERPLVAQREKRLRIFSDLYAHVEDPRRMDEYWKQKEKDEQKYRYMQLRLDKEKFLSNKSMYKHHMRQERLNTSGQYYEGENLHYRFQISVSVPVFEHTTSENITITLAEEKARKSTRTYPVNRLLGVAGIDIPIDHLKLILPYHKLGGGGSLFIIDHRGNIVLHDNTKPVFDGDILKPGYRTVDMIELEQEARIRLPDLPRNFSEEWLKFRKTILIDQSKGSKVVHAKSIFEDGMRAILEHREYHWRRVLDHYTVVVVLPKYRRRHAVAEGTFSKDLATKAFDSFDRHEFAVHPTWLYCKHTDPYFDVPEIEFLHFLKRRKHEPDFVMRKLKNSPIDPFLLEKTYICNEELMVRICKEGIATQQWASEGQDEEQHRDCLECELGSVTAFFASEGGLTRWQQYHATTSHAQAPSGNEWPRGPEEAWYKRAAAASDPTLVIHAPVTPIARFRKAEDHLPPLSIKQKWMTAARTLTHPDKGVLGVTGYHFYPKHLDDVVKAVSDFYCLKGDQCEPRCDGQNWTCVLVDEGGWLLAGHWVEEDEHQEDDPITEHLSRVYPHAMEALLSEQIFELHWIHDYQGVCFPPLHEKLNSASMIGPTVILSVWKTIRVLFQIASELLTLITVVSTGGLVAAETAKEKEKRSNSLRKNYEREKFDRLYDNRVLVNRTRFAACDRSRPLYVLNENESLAFLCGAIAAYIAALNRVNFSHTYNISTKRNPRKMELLQRPPDPCKWPLIGAPVPNTNLLLLAIMNSEYCPNKPARVLNDPFVNQPVAVVDEGVWLGNISASRLACWRNRVDLPTRAPHTTCYPHNYTQEEGYRQCGPWLPDPDQDE